MVPTAFQDSERVHEVGVTADLTDEGCSGGKYTRSRENLVSLGGSHLIGGTSAADPAAQRAPVRDPSYAAKGAHGTACLAP